MDTAYKKADLVYKYSFYFKLSVEKLEQYIIKAKNVLNIDRKGFSISIQLKIRRIFSSSQYKSKISNQLYKIVLESRL